LVGSSEAYCGKSAVILGLAHQFKSKGLDIAYGKPIGTCLSESQADDMDEDVRFIAQTLGLPQNRLLPTLLSLDETTITRRLSGMDQTNYYQKLQDSLNPSSGELVLLEGAGTLEEGRLFDLSLPQIVQASDASVLLVTRFHSGLIVESLMMAKQQLGDRLIGVLINDVPPEHLEIVENQVKAFLDKQDIEILGILPRSDVLRSVSVGELVHQLNAEVVCRPDRMELMVQSLKIGAMNVNSALEYLRKGHNMAVVTGGDRTDIQLAALETSTQCLILTGHLSPAADVLSRAEDLEIPILSVDLDTLTTVEIIDRTFGQVRVHEPIKVQTVYNLMNKHFDVDRLLAKLGMEPVAKAS
jgi:BioD-like phosphotransacetylase family protein